MDLLFLKLYGVIEHWCFNWKFRNVFSNVGGYANAYVYQIDVSYKIFAKKSLNANSQNSFLCSSGVTVNSSCVYLKCTVLESTFTGELWVVHASWQRLRYQIITAITKICGMHLLLEVSSICLNVFSYYNFIKIMSPCCQFGNCGPKNLNKILSINSYNDQMMWQIKIIECREKLKRKQ